MRRPGQSPPRPRLLHARAHLPELPGPRPGDRELRARRARARAGSMRERTLSVNIPAGVEDGTRIRLAGEGEAGVRGGPPGDLYIFLSIGSASVLSARRCRSALPRAGFAGDRGAGRRVRSSDHRRRQDPREGARRHADRPALPPARQGHAGAARAPERGHVRSGRRRDAAKAHQAPARTFAEFERLSSTETQPELSGFFGKVKEFLDGLGGGRANSA